MLANGLSLLLALVGAPAPVTAGDDIEAMTEADLAGITSATRCSTPVW